MDDSDLYDVLAQEVERVASDYSRAIADGSISTKDGLTIAYLAALRFHRVIRALADTTREQRRQAWLRAVDRFVSQFTSSTDIPYVPAIAERTFVDPLTNQLAHALAEGLFSMLEKIADEVQGYAG